MKNRKIRCGDRIEYELTTEDKITAVYNSGELTDSYMTNHIETTYSFL